jgi:hypothetical protein
MMSMSKFRFAIGYDTSFNYPFPVIGRNGTMLQSKWSPYPRTYISICVDEFPNMFFAYGPNSSLNDGPLLVVLDKQISYAIAATMKIQRERLKSLEVKKEAVDDFDEYLEVCLIKLVSGNISHSIVLSIRITSRTCVSCYYCFICALSDKPVVS